MKNLAKRKVGWGEGKIREVVFMREIHNLKKKEVERQTNLFPLVPVHRMIGNMIMTKSACKHHIAT